MKSSISDRVADHVAALPEGSFVAVRDVNGSRSAVESAFSRLAAVTPSSNWTTHQVTVACNDPFHLRHPVQQRVRDDLFRSWAPSQRR